MWGSAAGLNENGSHYRPHVGTVLATAGLADERSLARFLLWLGLRAQTVTLGSAVLPKGTGVLPKGTGVTHFGTAIAMPKL